MLLFMFEDSGTLNFHYSHSFIKLKTFAIALQHVDNQSQFVSFRSLIFPNAVQ